MRMLQVEEGSAIRAGDAFEGEARPVEEGVSAYWHAVTEGGISDAVIYTDLKFVITGWNEPAERTYGWKAREVIGKPLSAVLNSRVREGDPQGVLAHLRRYGEWKGKLVQERRDGSRILILSKMYVARNRDGKPFGFVSVNNDITEMERAEHEIRRRAAHAEALLSVAASLNARFELDSVLEAMCKEAAVAVNVPVAMVALHDEGTDVLRFASEYGLPSGLLAELKPISMDVYHRFTKLGGPVFQTRNWSDLWEGTPADTTVALGPGTLCGAGIRKRDGTLVGLLCLVAAGRRRTFSPDERSLIRGLADLAAQAILNARLMEERKRAEAQLFLTDRLASLGTLAAGMAHEVNNPLAYVNLSLEQLAETLKRLRPGAPLPATLLKDMQQSLSDAQDGVERVKTIVRDLKTFSRADDERHVPVDLRQVLDISVRMVLSDLRHRARLVRNFSESCCVIANESRLGQVFVNLLLNAIQAFPDDDPEHNVIRLTTKKLSEDRILIEIQDNGQGIPEEKLSKIFDPFFTTKRTGTGFGLAISYSIIKAMNGELRVESTEGVGTTFRIVLKGTAKSIPSLQRRGGSVASSPRSRILIIDDEPLIGKTLQRRFGREHDVVALTDARDALALLDKGERFDVILCDLMMPHMTGMDFYEKVKDDYAEMAGKLVFFTGGAFTPRARSFLDEVTNPRLEKPLSFDALRKLLSELLTPSENE